MLASQIPTLIPVPFASFAGMGYINPIPIPSQIGPTDPGLASMHDGFTPITFQPLTAGGIPPKGADVNGILNLESSISQWVQLGGGYPYNAAFSSAIGGYPKGAVVLRGDGNGYWVSTLDNNPDDPDTTFGNWLPHGGAPRTLVLTVSNANITLTPLQAACSAIQLNGTLTAPITLTFPNWPGSSWTIFGNYGVSANNVMATVPGGSTPVALAAAGTSLLACNGSNILTQFASGLLGSGVRGWMRRPDGLIEQWGTFTASGSGYSAIAFPISFPNACFGIQGSVQNVTSGLLAFMYNTPSATGFNGTTVDGTGYTASTASWRAIGN